jgi:hypothetical protein
MNQSYLRHSDATGRDIRTTTQTVERGLVRVRAASQAQMILALIGLANFASFSNPSDPLAARSPQYIPRHHDRGLHYDFAGPSMSRGGVWGCICAS